MEKYRQQLNQLIDEIYPAIGTQEYQNAATKLKDAFSVTLEACLKYFAKKPGKDLKSSVQKLLNQISNQEFINALINAYNYIAKAQNPQYQNEEFLKMAKDSLLDMMYTFTYIISDVDKGKTYRKEKLKNSFKNGIMTGTT